VLERLGELPPQRRPRRVRAGVHRLARVGVEVVPGLGAGRVAHVLPRLLVDHPDRRLEPAVVGRGPRAPQRSGVVPGALILRQDGCVPCQLGRLAPGPVQHGLVEALGADPSVLHAAADEIDAHEAVEAVIEAEVTADPGVGGNAQRPVAPGGQHGWQPAVEDCPAHAAGTGQPWASSRFGPQTPCSLGASPVRIEACAGGVHGEERSRAGRPVRGARPLASTAPRRRRCRARARRRGSCRARSAGCWGRWGRDASAWWPPR
jgi:hypothetical protein